MVYVYALNHNEFYIFGECIALSVMYGGSLPHFLSQAVLSYALDDTTLGEEIIDEIPSVECRDKVKKVCCVLYQ